MDIKEFCYKVKWCSDHRKVSHYFLGGRKRTEGENHKTSSDALCVPEN